MISHPSSMMRHYNASEIPDNLLLLLKHLRFTTVLLHTSAVNTYMGFHPRYNILVCRSQSINRSPLDSSILDQIYIYFTRLLTVPASSIGMEWLATVARTVVIYTVELEAGRRQTKVVTMQRSSSQQEPAEEVTTLT